MTKEKKKPQINKSSKPLRANQRNKPINEPLAPATEPIVPKRQISDLSLFFRREESISPPTVEQRFPMQHFIKNTSIEMLVLECSGLKMAMDKISAKISVDRNLLYSIVEKYLHGVKHQLWCDKYRPLSLNESLHQEMGEKIKSWLRVFHSYRNTVFEESNSFIDDYFGENSNNMQFKLLKEHGWKLKGLIIKGRESVGKSTAIKCTAKEMEYEILSCGNECNQIKFLKEKNEATQSECVKTKMNKNQTQIQRTNRSITTFAVQKEESELETQQSKRIQLMNNVNHFYPLEEETKFFNELNKTIESSKIPFIMTVNGEDVPETLRIYDVIEFEEAKTVDVARLLFLIYHVENAFKQCIDMEKIVDKDRFREVVNEQLARFEFEIKCPYVDFIKLTETFNKKLDRLFTFVQNSELMMVDKKREERINRVNLLNNNKDTVIDLKSAQQMMTEYLRRADENELMNDYFLVEGLNNNINLNSKVIIEDKESPSKELESSFLTNGAMEISKYLIDTNLNNNDDDDDDDDKEKVVINSDFNATFANTPNKEEYLENNENDNHHEESRAKAESKNISYLEEEKPFSEILHELQLKVISDYNPTVQSDECFIFNKLYNQSNPSLLEEKEEQTLHSNISMYIFIIITLYREKHKIIRKRILKNVKKEFYLHNEINTSIKLKELNLIGFLIDSRARPSRKKIAVKEELNLKKYLKQNEINYMKTFTDFLKPNSMESNNNK